MHAVYLTTNGDTTTFLSTPLEVQGYGCGIIELDGKVIIPKRLMKNKPKPMPSPPMTPTDEEGKIPPREELKDQSLEQNNYDDGFTNNLYLCSDIVEESDVGNIKMPVLRSLKRKNGIPVEINNVVWLHVKRPSISRIRLYIADDRGKVFSLPKNTLNCTLLFIPPK